MGPCVFLSSFLERHSVACESRQRWAFLWYSNAGIYHPLQPLLKGAPACRCSAGQETELSPMGYKQARARGHDSTRQKQNMRARSPPPLPVVIGILKGLESSKLHFYIVAFGAVLHQSFFLFLVLPPLCQILLVAVDD